MKNKLIVSLLCFVLCFSSAWGYEHSDFQIIKQLRKCNKKLERNPENAKLYIQRGYLNFMVGNYNDALSDYENAEKYEPNNHNIYYSIGRMQYILKNYDNSLENYTKAIHLKPKDAKSYVGRGLVKETCGNLQGAIEDYTKGIIKIIE